MTIPTNKERELYKAYVLLMRDHRMEPRSLEQWTKTYREAQRRRRKKQRV